MSDRSSRQRSSGGVDEDPGGLRLGLEERRLLLKGADLAGAAAAWWLLARPGGAGAAPALVDAGFLAVLALLWLVAAEGAGAYPPEAGRSPVGAADRAGDATAPPGAVPALPWGAALVAGVLLLGLHAAIGAPGRAPAAAMPGWPRALGFLAALVLLPGLLRLAVRPALRRPGLRPRVVVAAPAGDKPPGLSALERHGGAHYRLAGRVEADGEVARRAMERGADILALARPADVAGDAGGEIDRCVEAGIEVVLLATLVERLTGRVPLEAAGAAPDVLPFSPPATRLAHRTAKRALDLALVAVGLAFFLPVLPLLAAAIRLETPGPVFYTQDRVGRGGRVFRVYKLRSMVADAEAGGTPRWATEDDPRITRVGRFLRATHLDEFPQMLNILKGEMSPVGPRPERPEFIEELVDRIPHYRMRHAVRPGMAGWALVEHGYASSLEEARRKHEYDLYYVKHQSVWLDLVVLARTLVDTFTLGGR